MNILAGEVIVKTSTLGVGLHWFTIYSNGHPIYTEKVIILNE